MKYLLTVCVLLFSLSASAQWQQTGSRVRYVNAIGIPTKDTAAGVPADSSQILIRPADSSLYVKYKRTWLRVGGGGGSIAGSGTTNYIPKFTSASAIGNSQIFDNGTSVGIGTTPSAWRSGARAIQFGANGYGTLWEQADGSTDLAFAAYESASNTFAYKRTGDVPTLYKQVTGVHAWFNAPAGTAGNTITFTERMRITSAGDVGIGTTSPAAKLSVQGTTLINTNTDNGTDKLQVSGSATVSTLLGVGTSASSGTVHVKTTSPSIVIDDNDNNGTAAIRFRPQSSSFSIKGAIELVSTGSAAPTRFQISSTDTMTFRTNSVERVRVTAGTGAVLISKTTDNGIDKLQVNGSIDAKGFAQAYTSKGATYTATTSDYLIDCTTGTFTVNLPDALLNVGRILIIKNSGTGTVTVDGFSSQTIDGAATYSLSAQWATVQIMCDGSNWKIIAKF